jgi:hypothetical protein
MLFGRLERGQHVIARRDLRSGLGVLAQPRVRRGTRGIVRGSEHGLLRERYRVEFANGALMTVGSEELRRARFGHGDAAWHRRQETRNGVHLGLFLLTIPAIVAVARYYLRGGTTAGLAAALPGALAGALGDLASAVGVVPFALGLLAFLAYARMRRR